MHDLDRYWLWVTRAISEPANCNKKYFYDRSMDQLFAVLVDQGQITPLHFNSVIIFESVGKAFEGAIGRLQNGNDSIITLPRLSLFEKRMFLEEFIESIEDGRLKDKLRNEIEFFSDNDTFDFKIDIKSENNPLIFNKGWLRENS